MAKPEWGAKRVCQSCGARFYDMQKEPPVCPVCGTVFDPEVINRARRRPRPASAPVAKPEVDEEEGLAAGAGKEGDDAEAEEDAAAEDEEDSPIEDASELGEDDVSDVVEGGEDEDDR